MIHQRLFKIPRINEEKNIHKHNHILYNKKTFFIIFLSSLSIDLILIYRKMIIEITYFISNFYMNQ